MRRLFPCFHLYILSHTISLYSCSLFSSPSPRLPHLFLGPPLSLFTCLSANSSLYLPCKAREWAVHGEHVHVNNGGGRLRPNEVCLMADLSPSCPCVCECVWSRCTPIPLLNYSASNLFPSLPQKPLRWQHLGLKSVNRRLPTHEHRHKHIRATKRSEKIHVKTRFDWHDMAWLNSFVAFLHHLCSHIRDDWHFFFNHTACTFEQASKGVSHSISSVLLHCPTCSFGLCLSLMWQQIYWGKQVRAIVSTLKSQRTRFANGIVFLDATMGLDKNGQRLRLISQSEMKNKSWV